jgi:undecaprenyl-diphosphatase
VSILQAIVLGLVQGATEFAPVSSSGHLILVPWIFGWAQFGDVGLQKSFDVALHVGTLIGALVYFRHDVARYAAAWFRSIRARRMSTPDERIAWALFIGTIPGAIAGALFESVIEEKLGAPLLIALMLVAFALLLVWVDRRSRSDRAFGTIGPRDGLLLGAAQALALQPGVSRSGVTITVGRFVGLSRDGAARFAFLMSLPITTGALLFKWFDVQGDGGIPADLRAPFFWGIVASGITGYIAVWGTLKLVRTHSFLPFVLYRLALGVSILLLLATGFR